MDTEENRIEKKDILYSLEKLNESEFYQWFVSRLQPLESYSSRTAGAPWELIIWVYKQWDTDSLKERIIKCTGKLLMELLERVPKKINSAETFHLSIVISHLKIRELKYDLKKLAERNCIFNLKYREIDIREQMLYHLESLGFLDLDFWKKEIEIPRFAGAAFLSMTRVGIEQAILYLPHLFRASIYSKKIQLKIIFRIAAERQGMESFYQRIIDLFEGDYKESKWNECKDLAMKTLEQLNPDIIKYPIIPVIPVVAQPRTSMGIQNVLSESRVCSVHPPDMPNTINDPSVGIIIHRKFNHLNDNFMIRFIIFFQRRFGYNGV